MEKSFFENQYDNIPALEGADKVCAEGISSARISNAIVLIL